jgi:hypothetical protein
MDDPVVVVGADDVDDRVRLADVRQELVAEALALVRAADQARDVVEGDRVGDDVRGADHRRDLGEPLVLDRDDRDVRLDRGERVVRGLGPGAGQRVEQRRLARVGHPDDADLHRAALPMSVPNVAPATMSVG